LRQASSFSAARVPLAGPCNEWNFTVDPRYRRLMNWKKPDAAAARAEGD